METRTPQLTERQREIRNLLKANLTPQHIAKVLGFSTQYIYQVRSRLIELGALKDNR